MLPIHVFRREIRRQEVEQVGGIFRSERRLQVNCAFCLQTQNLSAGNKTPELLDHGAPTYLT